MFFFKSKNFNAAGKNKNAAVPNEVWLISRWKLLCEIGAVIISGLFTASAFPPLNWSYAAFFGMAPLIYLLMNCKFSRALVLTLVWNVSLVLTSFWWLGEINYAIPFLLAGALSIWAMLWGGLINLGFKYLAFPPEFHNSDFRQRAATPIKFGREILCVLAVASLWVLMEFSRSELFPWNFLAVSQWRNILLIQIAEYTGGYGISFLIVFINGALAMAIFQYHRKSKIPKTLIIGLILLTLSCFFGINSHFRKTLKGREDKIRFSFGLVQGDISQRRQSSPERAQEALDVYMDLSRQLVNSGAKIDAIIWPETAVPYPFFGSHSVSRNYRTLVYDFIRTNQMPMLIGSLDFILRPDGDYDLTNAALGFDGSGKIIGKYEKFYRVPYGEYVPFRDMLPEKLIEKISMGRDLAAGKTHVPLKLLPKLRCGVSICYESIFATGARAKAQLGANLLLAINNDAWYPFSSEPEQHLANAVIRCIETGLPALRVGNNGGTLKISDCGEITGTLSTAITGRGRAFGVIQVDIEEAPQLTFYSKFGDIFIFFISWLLLLAILLITYTVYRVKSARKL